MIGKERAYDFMCGKTIQRVVDNGTDSQILIFTDGTRINIYNDWYNDKGINYQLLDKDFNHIE